MSIHQPRRAERADKNLIRSDDLYRNMPVRKPLAGESELSTAINAMVREGALYEKLPDNRVHCFACAHHCKINDGGRGICQVRYNVGGALFVPRGYVAALQCDPIEKKPFFHVLPSSDALTFGMLGCDLHCGYCQNWDISQALRDPESGRPPSLVTPQQLVEIGKQQNARVMASSYNEPLITSEWAVEIFAQAKREGFLCAYVSNGNATREVLEYIQPYVRAYKIDLKTMRDKNYRALGAPLEHILDGIRMVHAMGFWLEIVTLVIPGFNDSAEELRDAAQFIASLSKDIPWHVTAFHPDYKMTDPNSTTVQQLLRACESGRAAGLNFVYAGNLPGRVGEWENTYCPNCGAALIERYGYLISQYRLSDEGTCTNCGAGIPGVWHTDACAVRLDEPYAWRMRRPRAV
ncbi:AmmeMemoRadiSam system radical SAM enzyme [Anaerolineae bacterium CFX7]|nr:AmmeMemoRadiSam system radical SAM enzyme [Anaerolineae bacterium CFX7]